MAKLLVNNVPDDLYAALQRRAEAAERSLDQEIVYLLSRAIADETTTSILDLQGLGAELWTEGEAEDHVRRERNSWDGRGLTTIAPPHPHRFTARIASTRPHLSTFDPRRGVS